MIGIRRAAAAFVAVAATTLAPSASVGAAPASAATPAGVPRVACADAAAAGEVTVAFVIDFSGTEGAPDGGIVEACVAVPPGDNDSEALAALSTEEGFPVPRYASSGLLCAIAAIPSHGCGQQVKGGYDYWSYWEGSPNGWTYANDGPAENTVDSSVVQGWRWEDPGKADPSDPSPRGPTTPGPICDPGPPPTTTTTTVAPSPTSSSTTPSTARTTAGGTGSLPRGPATTGTTSAPKGAAGSTTATTAGPARSVSTTSTTTARAGSHPDPASSSRPPATEPPGPGSTLGSAVTEGAGSKLASSSSKGRPGGGGGAPWLVIGLALLTVGVLGGGAAYRWRRAPPS